MDNNNETKESISTTLLVFNVILFFMVISMVFVIYSFENKPKNTNKEISFEKPKQHIFKDVSITAKSAYVYDVYTNKVLFKKNELVQLPLASITKIMTALTAVKLAPKDSNITIRKEFLSEEGDSGLLVNESWKLKDLLDFSLVVSSNDGARSIASVIGAFDLKSDDYNLGRKDFIAKMNNVAKDIGLKQTYFVNESGLDIEDVSGGYGSAVDVAKMVQYVLKNNPEILEVTKNQSVKVDSVNKTHLAKNTNSEVENIPGLIASKTGFTNMAGGNLVVAFDSSIGRPIIVVVLGSTQEGRFEDVEKLVKASLDYVVGE